jgi:transposase
MCTFWKQESETDTQATRGRPGANTQYVRKVQAYFDLAIDLNLAHLANELMTDGKFPLMTNADDLSPEEVLRAYKRQPLIEKRFSQFKHDFEVAPVYLKEVSRIQALLGVYFFVLLVQTLLEREIRHAMHDHQFQDGRMMGAELHVAAVVCRHWVNYRGQAPRGDNRHNC